MPGRRQNREIWGLIALFAVFIAFATYSNRVAQEATTPNTPSMYNAQGAGLKAFHLLLERQGLRVADLRSGWNALTPADGLLIVAEPLDPGRPITKEELEAVRAWVTRGGSVLFLVTAPARGFDPDDPLFGDVSVIQAEPEAVRVPPAAPDSPLLADVRDIAFRSPVRLLPAASASYKTLFRDDAGAIALWKPLGQGQLVVASAASIAENSGIREADNAVLLVNLAVKLRKSPRSTVLFDEYHHGVGLARSEGIPGKEGGLLENLPVPLRLGFLHLLGFGALLAYNANRRFGKRKTLAPTDYRPSTDYVGSLAKLYQRAGGADLALLELHHDFVRSLVRALDLPPDADVTRIVSHLAQRNMTEAGEMQILLTRCEQVRAGARITEAELLRLAQQMETLRRRLNLVGNQ